MSEYTLVDTSTEHGLTMRIFQHGESFSIRVDSEDSELMNNGFHYSEDVLAELACAPITERAKAHVLVRWNEFCLGKESGYLLRFVTVEMIGCSTWQKNAAKLSA